MEAVQQGPEGERPVLSPDLRVRLVAFTRDPFGLAVASARTCYASEFVFVGRLDRKGERSRHTLEDALPDFQAELREVGELDTPHERRLEVVRQVQARVRNPDVRNALALFADLARQRSESDSKLARAIYDAGHHTPFQHPTFVFAVENASRNVVESFLHNHIFYNSEQQSQRYVEMAHASVHVPASVRAAPGAEQVYLDAVRAAWDGYHGLRERLVEANLAVMSAIGRVKGQSERQVRKEAEKKAQEMARYVVPVAAHTQLYHTVSGIVLLRYLRMCEATNAASEARRLVEAMVEEVRRADPAFLQQIQETPRPRAQHVDWQLVGEAPPPPAPDWPADGPRHARLLHCTAGAGATVAQALREVTGSGLPDGELLRRLLDPAANPAWNDTLNTWDHSPALRALRHVHCTFAKRLSLTAFAQDQRHRMTPASRPLLQRCLTAQPDVHVPGVIASDAQARAAFDAAVGRLWSAMHRLVALGVPPEDATYLLPNAANLRFTQSGDLLSLLHKWRLRLCFNAQREIFDASLEELRQVLEAMPELARHAGPPCSFVAAAQPADRQDDVEACCPEASWCGVKVWKTFDARKGVPKRPY